MIEILSYAWPLWFSNVALNLLGLDFIRTRDKAISERIFGGSATWGGVSLSIIMGAVLWAIFPAHALIFWKPIAACVGHCAASFIKRRMGIGRGEYVPFLTHGDYIVAFAVISLLAGSLDLKLIVLTYLLTIAISPLATWIGYRLKLRKDPL
ncbi:MAG: CDP-archaeol synthase [bacterium]|nr:CDP-archaeol synthase [bacterium]